MIERLLTALLDAELRRLPREPNLHDKRMLGYHAHDDAQSLADLGGAVRGDPEPVGDKATLIALVKERLARLDPVGDEAEFAVLTLLLRRQERHLTELPWLAGPQAEPPAREPFVELGAEGPGSHSDLNRALIHAEVAAVTALDHHRLELTAVIAARCDETATLEATLESPWGSKPVSLTEYDRLLALALDDRVEELLREGGGSDEDAAL